MMRKYAPIHCLNWSVYYHVQNDARHQIVRQHPPGSCATCKVSNIKQVQYTKCRLLWQMVY